MIPAQPVDGERLECLACKAELTRHERIVWLAEDYRRDGGEIDGPYPLHPICAEGAWPLYEVSACEAKTLRELKTALAEIVALRARPAPSDERLRQLARFGALIAHENLFDPTANLDEESTEGHTAIRTEDDPYGFKTCPHGDCARFRNNALLEDDTDDDTDDVPTISVHELRGWILGYALDHQGTERQRIADEIANYIDRKRAT